MEKLVFTAYMIYLLLGIAILLFIGYILPPIVGTIWEQVVKIDFVERIILFIEEIREWGKQPGKHYRHSFGVYRSDDTFFKEQLANV